MAHLQNKLNLNHLKCIMVILLLLTFKSAYSQGKWIALEDSTNSQRVVTVDNLISSTDSITFRLSYSGFYTDSIVQDDTLYRILNLSGEYSMMQPGNPGLPLIRKLLALPECTAINVELTFDSLIVLNNYLISPAFNYIDTVIDSNATLLPVFSKNHSIYQSYQWFPANQFEVNTTGHLREQKLAEVFFYPFQFNPALNQLRVCKEMNVKVTFENPHGKINNELGIFRNVARHSALNYTLDELGPASQAQSTGQGSVHWYTLTSPADVDLIQADYLIITAGRFFSQNNLQSETYRIAKHRADYNGYDVAILNVENIVSDAVGFEYGTDQNAPIFKTERRIKACIKRLYANNLAQHTADGKLAYVLLVGDAKAKAIPNWLYEGVPAAYEHQEYTPNNGWTTDYYYACLTDDGNWQYDFYGDLFIGRFSADDDTELHNIIEKTIAYETESAINTLSSALYSTGDGLSGSYAIDYFNSPNGFYNEYLPRIINNPYSFMVRNLLDPSTLSSTLADDIISDLNKGNKLLSFYGHSEMTIFCGHEAPYYIEHLQNTYKYPFFFSLSCNIGSYEDCTPTWPDCFSEDILTLSPTKGYVGAFTSKSPQAIGFSSTVTLPIVPSTFYEYFQECYWNRFAHMAGELALLTKNSYLTASPPSVFMQTNPQFNYNLFCDPALNLFTEGYQVSQNLTLSGDVYISTPVTLKSGYTITALVGTHIHFIDKGALIIEPGANLNFNFTATLSGVNSDNYLLVNGNINTLYNLTFTALEGNHWNGLLINNPALALTVNQTSSFMRCGLRGRWLSLSIDGTSFNDSWLSLVESSADIQNCPFSQSYIVADNEGGSKSAYLQVKNCTFSGTPSDIEAIRMEGYPIFNIEGNTITFGGTDGIALYNCGSLAGRAHYVGSNEVTYNGAAGGFNNGIKLYNSYCELNNNFVHHNPVGISFLNLTTSSLMGNSLATNSTQTQRITNNSIYQLYLSQVSSAPQIKWNAISPDVNIITYPYIHYDQASGYSNPIIDVSNNYWGSAIFVPDSALIPLNKFIYDPVWALPNKSALTDSTGQELFNTAIGLEADSNYAQAEANYKSVIEQYPATGCAAASLSHLFRLSDYVFNNLQTYKLYFLSDTVIINHPHLKRIGQWLANRCDIALGNYQQAELWLDSIVQNPASASDSLYALIDLAQVLTLYDTSALKQAVYLNSESSMPKDQAGFREKRKEWIDGLYLEALKTETEQGENDTLTGESGPNICKIYPNPANEQLTVCINTKSTDMLTIEFANAAGFHYIYCKNKPAADFARTVSIDLKPVKKLVGTGVCFILVSTGTQTITKPIVIL